MRRAYVNVTFAGKSFKSNFDIEDHIQEYQVADEAYRLAMLFAETQVIAEYGHMVSFHKFVELLQQLDYNYYIMEVTDK